MAKNTNKTTETVASVSDFINTIADETKRADSFKLTELMEEASSHKAKMWGPAIIGFGSYHYKYDSGREGDAPLIAFSPRKSSLTLYLPGFESKEQLLQKLGKHKQSGGCTHIVKLTDVDNTILRQLLNESFKHAETTHCK
ncbi:protein of unknown function (DU1801) [Mucilaginibacter gossypiicola]|uniref:YdhG-like domain-containing protein n=1 Tax=Mucilaginibacter gossypiicola TaxID=551995 RepID=A0A1H8RCU3_9SPHI|nr:DUF1801 domain-containing protein [Mucilaginibacter gossypiicola]SEO64221.1 protein of unknown function (DU1801) [Mucilaginibacter gossypiicola]